MNELLAAMSLLRAGYVFTAVQLAQGARPIGTTRGGSERVPQFEPQALDQALYEATAQGMIREVELRPRQFAFVRTEVATPESLAGSLPLEVRRRLAEEGLGVRQPSPEEMNALLDVPADTVALRRAIIDPDQFVWLAADYARLVAVATES